MSKIEALGPYSNGGFYKDGSGDYYSVVKYEAGGHIELARVPDYSIRRGCDLARLIAKSLNDALADGVTRDSYWRPVRSDILMHPDSWRLRILMVENPGLQTSEMAALAGLTLHEAVEMVGVLTKENDLAERWEKYMWKENKS